jgi:NADH-quinone oxidoreductase subunit N
MDLLREWSPVLLEILAVAGAVAVLLLDLYTPEGRKERIGALSVGVTAVLTLAAWFVLEPGDRTVSMFGGSLVLDPMAIFLKRTFAVGGLLACALARVYEDRLPRGRGEFHFLLLTALSGMFLVSGAGDLMTMFVSLELVTLSFFVLAAFHREKPSSVEAGLKLLVLGSLAAAFVLFGSAFVYGAVGDVHFDRIRHHVASHDPGKGMSPELLFGLLFVFLGLGFKIGMVPMQVWVPDVYQGAPTPVTAFLAVGSKAAGFALVLRLVATVAMEGPHEDLQVFFGALAFATLFYGNLAAIPQTNIKRLMGYSSIGHCGYLLLGLAALGGANYRPDVASAGTSAVLFYLLAYALTTMAAFLVISLFSAVSGSDELDDYAGLAKRSPLLAASLAVALLSLAGVPPLAGFFGKFMLLRAVALDGPHGLGFVLLAAGGVNVVIGLYYYLCVIKRMYMHEAKDPAPLAVPSSTAFLLYSLTATLLLIGIFPAPFVTLATEAAKVAFGIG